jgi:pimeloyl-ACP methyl ester carboxylesterase
VETYTNRDGLELAYQQWGERGDRPPVVLVHGFIANGDLNWRLPGVVDALVAAGRSVIAPDARGHGRSAKPHDPALYGEEVMAGDVRELFDRLGADTYDLAGYSMGGIVSLLVATEDERVRRLFVGGIGNSVATGRGGDRRALDLRAVADALEAEDPATIGSPGAKAFRAFADRAGGDRLALAAQARASHLRGIAVDRITAPTLVVTGDGDALAGHADDLAAAIPNGEWKGVSGDHLGAVDDPAFTRYLVDFFAA